MVDPQRNGLATKADVWLQVRPGADGALALGIANAMIDNEWYDREFIRDWSNGPLLVRVDTGHIRTSCNARSVCICPRRDKRLHEAVLVLPKPEAGYRAPSYAPDAPSLWHAQRDGYQRMPVLELLQAEAVGLLAPLEG